MRALREFWWKRIRRYRYEICDRCGRPSSTGIGGRVDNEPTTYWFADSELWNLVIGGPFATDDPGGIRCPRCFEDECRQRGIHIGWRASRVGDEHEAARREIVRRLRNAAGRSGAHGSSPALAIAADWLEAQE